MPHEKTPKAQGPLHPSQEKIAHACKIIMRSLAKLGIIALVDEATGYQELRDRLALQKMLEKYFTDEWAKWTRTFPDEFYKHLFRLKGLEYPVPGGRRPRFVGHWTNDIVYLRLAPGVLEELRKKNPRNEITGERLQKHHQYLTRDYRHPALKEHLSNVIFLMRTCATDEEFREKLRLNVTTCCFFSHSVRNLAKSGGRFCCLGVFSLGRLSMVLNGGRLFVEYRYKSVFVVAKSPAVLFGKQNDLLFAVASAFRPHAVQLQFVHGA
jgi:hypothetical protein